MPDKFPNLKHLVTVVAVYLIIAAELSLQVIGQPLETSREKPDTAVEADVSSGEGPEVDAVYGTVTLPALSIVDSEYKIPLTQEEKMRLRMFEKLSFNFDWLNFSSNHVFTPGRTRGNADWTAQSARVFHRAEMQMLPPISLNGALLSELEFNASPRSVGSPANSDVRLRGVTSLVLRDGVPLNDPYDGRIKWAEIPRAGLARTEIVPGGGSSAWGQETLGGVVQFFTLPASGTKVTVSEPIPNGARPDDKRTKEVIVGTTDLAIALGELNTQSAEFVTSQPTSHGIVQVLGRGFRTDGFSLVSTEQRGPIDLAASNRHHWLEARWRQPVGETVELVATVRGFDESYGNGTAYQRGSSRGTFASLALAGRPKIDFDWNAIVYLQGGSSAYRFSAVNSGRTTESPVIDQYALPTSAYGANWTGTWRHGGNSRTRFGIDLRSVRGESRENVDFVDGVFTHQLIAGGKQDFVGLFVLNDWSVAKNIRATIGARIDGWNETDGHRLETERLTQAVLLDERYLTKRGLEFNPCLGFVWQATENWAWRVYGQQAFRRPTLDERYDSSGSSSVVMEANPNLRTEHNTSAEIATNYSVYRHPKGGGKQGPAMLTLGAKVFLNRLRDVVGNAAVARGSGEFPLLDTLPAGYRGEKRINFDRARVQGLDLSVAWRPSASLTLEANILFNDATVLRATLAPNLQGKQMASLPRRTVLVSAWWRASEIVSFQFRVRSNGRRFDDAENTLLLDKAVIADVGATWTINQHTELYLSGENIFGERIETGRSADSLVYTGSPRLIFGGVRLKW